MWGYFMEQQDIESKQPIILGGLSPEIEITQYKVAEPERDPRRFIVRAVAHGLIAFSLLLCLYISCITVDLSFKDSDGEINIEDEEDYVTITLSQMKVKEVHLTDEEVEAAFENGDDIDLFADDEWITSDDDEDLKKIMGTLSGFAWTAMIMSLLLLGIDLWKKDLPVLRHLMSLAVFIILVVLMIFITGVNVIMDDLADEVKTDFKDETDDRLLLDLEVNTGIPVFVMYLAAFVGFVAPIVNLFSFSRKKFPSQNM